MTKGVTRLIPKANNPRRLLDIAQKVRIVIERAELDGVIIDDGNVMDLLANNIAEDLSTLRAALVICGHGHRFPRATRGPMSFELPLDKETTE